MDGIAGILRPKISTFDELFQRTSCTVDNIGRKKCERGKEQRPLGSDAIAHRAVLHNTDGKTRYRS